MPTQIYNPGTKSEPAVAAAPTTTSVPVPSKPLELSDISQLGYLQKTREVFKGVTVTLQTLSISRQQKILATLPPDTTDPVIRFTQLQVETLSNATLAINADSFTEADLEKLRHFYAGLQSRVLQAFYAVYQEMMDEQEATLGGLKKT